MNQQEQQQIEMANKAYARRDARLALEKAARRIRGEKLRAEIDSIIDAALVNAGDTANEVMRSESERASWAFAFRVEPQREWVYEQSFEGSVAVWYAERSTSNAARRWLAKRGYIG